MSQINSEKIKEYIGNGLKIAGGLALELYGRTLDDAGNNAFEDAIEIGISNTVQALYEADVTDEKIVAVLNEVWGINKTEATDRLVFEKSKAPQRKLTEYLKLQGWSSSQIAEFLKTNKVGVRLRHEPELRALRRQPEKLMKAVQEPKK